MIASTIVAATIWTQADIDKLKAAVGGGVLKVTYSGPPSREVTYQSLDAMRAVLAEMRREVNGHEPFRLAATNKGFRMPTTGRSNGDDGSSL